MDAEIKFEAPGPGPWEAESAHFPRPMTHFRAESGLLLSDTPAHAIAAHEHARAVSVFCVALAAAAICALSLPGRAASGLAEDAPSVT